MACTSAAAATVAQTAASSLNGSRFSSGVAVKSNGHVKLAVRSTRMQPLQVARAPQLSAGGNVFRGRQGVAISLRTSQQVAVQAVEKELATSDESSSTATAQKTTYYYIIANAKFMLDDEEHFQEQMQEKLRMYGERNKEQDFWMVIEPQFLDKHPEVANRLNRPAVALVSTDKVWITFMKLRLDRVLKGEITVDSPKKALLGNLTTVKFERPEKWIAPYPKYEGDWWTPFLYKEE